MVRTLLGLVIGMLIGLYLRDTLLSYELEEDE
jgi:hypothetical protein